MPDDPPGLVPPESSRSFISALQPRATDAVTRTRPTGTIPLGALM
jgi:hypothetical protein